MNRKNSASGGRRSVLKEFIYKIKCFFYPKTRESKGLFLALVLFLTIVVLGVVAILIGSRDTPKPVSEEELLVLDSQYEEFIAEQTEEKIINNYKTRINSGLAPSELIDEYAGLAISEYYKEDGNEELARSYAMKAIEGIESSSQDVQAYNQGLLERMQEIIEE